MLSTHAIGLASLRQPVAFKYSSMHEPASGATSAWQSLVLTPFPQKHRRTTSPLEPSPRPSSTRSHCDKVMHSLSAEHLLTNSALSPAGGVVRQPSSRLI